MSIMQEPAVKAQPGFTFQVATMPCQYVTLLPAERRMRT